MHLKEISHPQGPQGCCIQGVKKANLGVLLKHKQCRDITTSESGTLKLGPLSIGKSIVWLSRFQLFNKPHLQKGVTDDPDSNR